MHLVVFSSLANIPEISVGVPFTDIVEDPIETVTKEGAGLKGQLYSMAENRHPVRENPPRSWESAFPFWSCVCARACV